MKRVHHLIWLVRWTQRLGSAVLRRRKVVDLLPSLLAPRHRLLYDRRTRRIRRLGVRKTLSDYWAYDQCLASSGLDLSSFPQGKGLEARYRALLAAGRRPIVIDCGANIGCSTYWLAAEFPDALVIGVEPDAANAALAELNLRACPNARIVRGAIASEDCHVDLTNEAGASDGFRTRRSETGQVRGYAISTLMRDAGAGLDDLLLVKVDIEGFEQELFSRNTEWVQAAAAIILEPHDWMLPGQATTLNVLRELSRMPRDFLVHGEHLMSFRN